MDTQQGLPLGLYVLFIPWFFCHGKPKLHTHHRIVSLVARGFILFR